MATIIEVDQIPTISTLFKLNRLRPPPANSELPKTLAGPNGQVPLPSKALNDRVAVTSADITTLAADAIVNAANSRLAGGGGIDGAIHKAAGAAALQAECRHLNGCPTGSAKMTGAHALPCKKIIHAVGPAWHYYTDKAEAQALLASCYRASLRLAAGNRCESIVLPPISTGIYAYPRHEATAVALATIRRFLTDEDPEVESKVKKVILTVIGKADMDQYAEFIPYYFPPVPDLLDAASGTS